jgi:hypothetical protein
MCYVVLCVSLFFFVVYFWRCSIFRGRCLGYLQCAEHTFYIYYILCVSGFILFSAYNIILYIVVRYTCCDGYCVCVCVCVGVLLTFHGCGLLYIMGADYMLLSGIKSVQGLECFIVCVNVGFVRV